MSKSLSYFKAVTFCLLHFALKILFHFASKSCYILRQKLLHFGLMLHFSLMLHFASIVTFCGVTPTPRDGPCCSSVLIFIDSQWGGNLPKVDTWSWAPLFPRSFSSTLYNAGTSLRQKSCAGRHSVCLTEIWLYSMSSMPEKGRRQNSESRIGIKSKVACLATPSL